MTGKEKTGIWGMKEQEKVLFVVYRTEWWGCFDNLCRQECLKEDTLVYVMPIPRYDRDLGTTEMNYSKVHFTPEQLERELPEGACLVDYQTFSLEQGFERIYIHNPYDNTYYVDSVDPKYYSWILKAFAEKLVYVSYLLYIGGIPEEFAHCSVYEHVDAIYLANERAKYSLDVKYDQKVEIVPSGIPEYLAKLEERLQQEHKVGTGREGSVDGTNGRKKLLCCLSYNNLYYGSEKLIEKLRGVFEYLRGRKDILLIFRPDEDIRARFGWLPEPVRKKYVELVTYFQKSRVGVYDESADLYRAVAEADGILSFGHPADNLISVQGKYVLHLDQELRPIPSDEVRCILSLRAATAAVERDGIEVWFVPESTRLICKMVIQESAVGKAGAQYKGEKSLKQQAYKPQIEIVAEVPDEIIGGLNYINVTKIGNCLYLSPYQAENIWKYDLETNCFSGQYLPNAAGACIAATFFYGGYLYLIPKMYPGIVKYDTETGGIRILDGWIEELESHVLPENKKKPYFCLAAKQEKNILYMASSKCDVWMEFDMDSDTWQMKSMNLAGKHFVDMIKKGERVWLFPLDGDEVILWNCITGESQVIYAAAYEESRNMPYQYALDIGDAIVAFPGYNNILCMPVEIKLSSNDKTKRNVEITNRMPYKEKDYLSEYQRQSKIGYQFVKKMGDGQILAYEYYDGSFLILNEGLQLSQKINCRLPLEVVRRQQNIIWENMQCKNEFSGGLSEGYFLPAMLDYFVQHGQDDREDINKYYTDRLKQ